MEVRINKAWFYAVLAFAVFGTQNSVMMVPPLLVEVATYLEISVAVAGQMATATFAAWAVAVLTVGPLSDSFGRRPVALTGMALTLTSVVASAFAPNIETLLALRFLTGFGGGTLPPNAVGALSDVISPARRAQAVSGMLVINGVAAAVSAPLAALLADAGNILLDGSGGWRIAFLAGGLLLATAFTASWVWFPRERRDRVRNWEFLSRYRELISRRYFRVAVPVGISQRIAYWSMTSFFAAYLINTYSLDVGFAALPLGIVASAQVVGSYCAAFVATSRSRAVLLAGVSVAGGALGLVSFGFPLGLWTTVAVAMVSSGLLSVPIPALVAISTEYSGESKATGASLMGLSNQSGGMFGAGISGVILASSGYAGIGYLLLAASVLSAALTGLFGRQFGEVAGRT
ncbi:MAG: MFS transporter [Chloroflexi bacterium]|nr:MFS transporter [Chloroflexota bacterium]